mgnify:CR=1 FL=1
MTSRNSESLCQHFSSYNIRNMKPADCPNITSGKPPSTDVSTFRHRIQSIIFFRSDKQMVRPNAWRIVTAMKNAHVFRNRAIVNLPRNAMCRSHRRTSNHPIFIWSSASPNPTSSSFFNLGPKSLFERDTTPTNTAAKFASLSFHRRRFSSEFVTTFLTNHNSHER